MVMDSAAFRRYQVLDLQAGDVDQSTRRFSAQKSSGVAAGQPVFQLFLWNSFVSKYHVGVHGGSPWMGLGFIILLGACTLAFIFTAAFTVERTISW